MKNIFMTSVFEGNNNYRDAVNILEDSAYSQNWEPIFISTPTPFVDQYFLGSHTSKVIFFHTGTCTLFRNSEENPPYYRKEGVGLFLDGLHMFLDNLIQQLDDPYELSLPAYVIIFLIIDKDSNDISEAINNAIGINAFEQHKRLFYVVTIEANRKESVSMNEYTDSIPLVIRDFAEAFSSTNNILNQSHIHLDDLIKLFPGSKIYSSRIQMGDNENSILENNKSLGTEIKLASPQQNYSKSGDVYDVWFGTNRLPNDVNNFEKGFGNGRDTKINYGICSVKIPKTHKIGDGQPSFWRRIFGAEMMRLENIKGFNVDDFWNSIKSAVNSLPQNDKSATIFVHGYNVEFEEAAIQTAQMLADINLPGIFAFYSWPSQGTLKGYPADESTIIASVKFISEFIGNFAAMAGAENINIIAHSMGNRGVLDAFERVLKQTFSQTGKKINQIILAAPDVDADVFNELYNVYTVTSKRTTIYVSDRDRALEASGFIHQYPRTGLTPPVTICNGVDTVFVGDIDLSLLGHGYVSNNRIVLTDMHQLLLDNTEPSKRMGLSEEITPQGSYYKIK